MNNLCRTYSLYVDPPYIDIVAALGALGSMPLEVWLLSEGSACQSFLWLCWSWILAGGLVAKVDTFSCWAQVNFSNKWVCPDLSDLVSFHLSGSRHRGCVAAAGKDTRFTGYAALPLCVMSRFFGTTLVLVLGSYRFVLMPCMFYLLSSSDLALYNFVFR